MTTESYAKGISTWLDLIRTMGPVYSRSSPASDFEQRSAGKAEPGLVHLHSHLASLSIQGGCSLVILSY